MIATCWRPYAGKTELTCDICRISAYGSCITCKVLTRPTGIPKDLNAPALTILDCGRFVILGYDRH